MGFDVARARAETPGCKTVIHLANGGAGLMPTPVLNAVKDHLDLEAQIGGYEARHAREDQVEGLYESAARYFNCSSDEIACVENATVAWDMAFYSMSFKPGDRILTAVSEYASNYIAYLQMARRTGAVIEVVPNDNSGQLDVKALENMIDSKVKLISVTHVPTNGGLVNPAAAIGKVARAAGIPYLLDACQSFGQMKLDVEEIGCDMASVTGRKYMRGPRGTGLLYVRKSMLDKLEPPFLDLHSALWTGPDRYEMQPNAKRFENWEKYVAGQIGLKTAIDYAMGWGIDAIEARVTELADGFRRKLSAIPGVTVRDLGEKRCGIVTFTRDGVEPEAIMAAMSANKINCSVSRISSTRIDMTQRGLEKVLRTGVHYYNNDAELDRFLEVLEGVK